MELRTLEGLFRESEHPKLYVISYLMTRVPDFLTGYASKFRRDGNSVLLDLEPLVFYSLRNDLVHQHQSYFGLRLYARDGIALNFQEHKSKASRVVRNNFGKQTEQFQKYLRLSKELTRDQPRSSLSQSF